MRRMALVVLTLLCSSYAFGQSDDYKKVEVFGGYSLMHFDRAAETNNPNLTTLLEGKELDQEAVCALTLETAPSG